MFSLQNLIPAILSLIFIAFIWILIRKKIKLMREDNRLEEVDLTQNGLGKDLYGLVDGLAKEMNRRVKDNDQFRTFELPHNGDKYTVAIDVDCPSYDGIFRHPALVVQFDIDLHAEELRKKFHMYFVARGNDCYIGMTNYNNCLMAMIGQARLYILDLYKDSLSA